MRVLLVHGYYKERGGEDVAFETDAKLLSEAGHEIRTLPFHNAEIGDALSVRDRLGLAASTVWSRSSANRIAAAVADFEPEIVHFHNTFPLISPAAFSAAGRHRVPVVATLHNYRLVCANADLYRDGAVCEDCLGRPIPYPAVQHACYRDGRAESAVVATMQVAHRARRTWTRDVDRFITPSAFARNKLIEAGMPAARVSVRTNAVIAPTGVDQKVHSSLSGAPRERTARDGFLYVGRLAPNKGIATLLDAWRGRDDMPVLHIAGDGELGPEVRAAAALNPAIKYLGSLPHDEVVDVMRRSIALIVPSSWYEIQGLVILEAFSCATPVIASHIGAIPEAVHEGRTGLLVPPGDAGALAERVRWAAANSGAMRSMGVGALDVFETDFSPDRSLAQLVEVYEMARAERRSRRPSEPQLEPV